MRITVGDVDAHRAQVFFNGTPITMCNMADEERGEVVVYVADRDGRILISEATGDALAQTAHGSVSVFVPQCHTDGAFDAWMRERTDTPHHAMMKHARRGSLSYETKKGKLQSAIPGTQVALNSGGHPMKAISMTYDV